MRNTEPSGFLQSACVALLRAARATAMLAAALLALSGCRLGVTHGPTGFAARERVPLAEARQLMLALAKVAPRWLRDARAYGPHEMRELNALSIATAEWPAMKAAARSVARA